MPKIEGTERIDPYRIRVPKGFVQGMRTEGIIYVDEILEQELELDSVRQVANVATLPGIVGNSLAMPDIHTGYGFPIGGVAAFDVEEGIISPGGVGYDINCLCPGTKVLTEHGYWINIEDALDRYRGERLKIFDSEEGHNDNSELLIAIKRKRDENEFAFQIITETERKIEGSREHPVLTVSGYTPIEKIKENDFVLVYPFEGVEYEEKEGIIIDEKSFTEENSHIVLFFKNRNLLPLRFNSPYAGILARIVGFAFGDGHLGKKHGRVSISFYGKPDNLNELKKDLEKIGISSFLYEGKSVSAELRVSSRAFALLLKKLGLPAGKKTETAYSVPDWIMKAPLWIKRNFLSGLFGADGSIPIFRGCTPLPVNLTQSKIKDLENNLLNFLDDVRGLLEEFAIQSIIYKIKSKKNPAYRLSIVGEENIRLFLGRINYEYALDKKERALHGYAYLTKKKLIMKTNSPDFKEYVQNYCLKGGFVKERVVTIKKLVPTYDYFFDIGVLHRAHNFIANGVVVHNCGVRLLKSNLTREEVEPKIRELIDLLYTHIPSGVGSTGKIRLTPKDSEEVVRKGAIWAIQMGYGEAEDIQTMESNGCLDGADPELISKKAYERGREQLGTLGSGNHFLEVQYVDEIYEPDIAEKMGLFKGQITVMIHSGSRGFGHQICDDYIRVMIQAAKKYGIELPDKELACSPFKSKEGQQYFSAMKGAANYAWANRQCLTHWTREVFLMLFKLSPRDLGMKVVFDVAHNIAKEEIHLINSKKQRLIVHRKGATRAFPKKHPELPDCYRDIGQPVIIPGDMGRVSFVLVGEEKAMKETFGSTCHGAGRLLSRHQAIRQAKGRSIKQEMADRGIIVRAAGRETLAEEMPEAYKNVSNVIDVVHNAGIARKVARLRPLGVIKG